MSDEVKKAPSADAEAAKYFGLDLSTYREEPAEEEPQVEVEDEVEVEDAGDELPDEPVEDAEPDQSDEPEPKRPDLMDKEVQRLQQLNATLEREVERMKEDKSDQQVKRVEKAKSKLDKYLNEKDIDPYEGVADLASEAKSTQESVNELLEANKAILQRLAESEARHRTEVAQMRFAVDHPSLAGRYTEFAQKAHEAVVELIGDSAYSIEQAAYERLANKEFVRLVGEETKEPEVADAPARKPVKKPKGSHIIKKKAGTPGKIDNDDPDAAMAKIRAAWDGS